MGVTNHMLVQQAGLPRLHSLLPRLKNVINDQPGPVPKVGREEENGWERFQGDDGALKLQKGLIKQAQSLYLIQNGI